MQPYTQLAPANHGLQRRFRCGRYADVRRRLLAGHHTTPDGVPGAGS